MAHVWYRTIWTLSLSLCVTYLKIMGVGPSSGVINCDLDILLCVASTRLIPSLGIQLNLVGDVGHGGGTGGILGFIYILSENLLSIESFFGDFDIVFIFENSRL